MQLTRREQEVLQLIADGWTNREIATRLVLSENTVRRHVSNILSKLGCANRREAAREYRKWSETGDASAPFD